MKRFLLVAIGLASLLSASAQEGYQALRFRQPLAYHQYIMRDLHRQTAARDAAFAEAVQSKPAMEQYVRDIRSRMAEIAGELPERGPLNARTVATVQGDGFIVEKVIFQSAPGRYVTAHLYRPEKVRGRIPACVEMPGHSAAGKGNGSAQATLMARNGIAVIHVDPLGQGERMQLIDAQGQDLTRGATTEHTLLNVPYVLLGSNLAAQQAFDNSRAVDYLLTRSDIDPKRIGCYGFSGGGTMASYLIALDDRIQCACVGLFFSSRLRTLELIGPSDGCQQMPFEGRERIEGADLVLAMAPRPVIILDGKYDFVDHWGALQGFEDLQKAYTALGCPERVSQYYAEDGHATPPDVQQHLIDWFRHWLLGQEGPAVDSAPWRGTDMLCTASGQVNLEFPDARSTMQATLADMDALAPARKAFCGQDMAAVQAGIRRLLGISGNLAPVQAVPSGSRELRGFTEYRFQLNREGEFPVPVIIRVPENVSPASAVEIRLSDQGKAALLGEMDRYDAVSDGTILVFADLRGMGESSDPVEYNLLKYWNKEYRIAATSLHIGRPLPGQRVVDVLTLLDFCDTDARLRGRPVRIAAEGFCGPVVAHAAVLDGRITRAALSRSLRSWRSYLENPLQYDMLSNVVPGALRYYDLPDLVRLSGGRITYMD